MHLCLEKTIGFWGGGNMAACIIRGLVAAGFPASQIYVCDRNPGKLTDLETHFHVKTTDSPAALISQSDVLVMAVKPQGFVESLKPFQQAIIDKKPLFISIAAGITVAQMHRLLSDTVPVIRAMPNTPSALQKGATGLYADRVVTETSRTIADEVLGSVGMTAWVEQESLLEVVTAISGCGPAYYFLLLDYISQIGREMGLEASVAKQLAQQTMLGAAEMAVQSPLSFEQLRAQVMSKKGVTAAAVDVLETSPLQQIFRDAMQTAKARSLELSKELDEDAS